MPANKPNHSRRLVTPVERVAAESSTPSEPPQPARIEREDNYHGQGLYFGPTTRITVKALDGEKTFEVHNAALRKSLEWRDRLDRLNTNTNTANFITYGLDESVLPKDNPLFFGKFVGCLYTDNFDDVGLGQKGELAMSYAKLYLIDSGYGFTELRNAATQKLLHYSDLYQNPRTLVEIADLVYSSSRCGDDFRAYFRSVAETVLDAADPVVAVALEKLLEKGGKLAVDLNIVQERIKAQLRNKIKRLSDSQAFMAPTDAQLREELSLDRHGWPEPSPVRPSQHREHSSPIDRGREGRRVEPAVRHRDENRGSRRPGDQEIDCRNQ